MNRIFAALFLVIVNVFTVKAQNSGELSGSLESQSHYYLRDDVLQIVKPQNPVASNNYLHIRYINGPFSSALQYEAYMPPISGYPYQLEGIGISHLSFRYAKEVIDITAGSFYEQFGNGLSFRAYESRELGIDNAVNGLRIITKPLKFFTVKVIYGKPRKFFEISDSYLRGVDAELDLGELISSRPGLKFGGGIIGRYEEYTGPADDFPSNVNACNLRFNASFSKINVNTEYVFKGDDPTSLNLYSSARGHAFLINTSYTSDRLGIFTSARFLDAMDFRSERESEGNYLMVNYLPANTWQHTFLLGSIYPFITKPDAEASIQTDINYSPEKGSFLGGRYGTKFRFGFSHVRNLKSGDNTLPVLISFGDKVYYQDLTMEINRKWSRSVKTITSITALQYNKSEIEYPGADFVKAIILNIETQIRIYQLFSIRTELQHLWTRQDWGNWFAGLAEVGWSPHLSLFISDMIDYQNDDSKAHYYNSGISFTTGYMRISAGYGRHREGQICAGGICQRVPAFKGFNMKTTVNF